MATVILKLVGQLKNDYIIKTSSFEFTIDDLKKCLKSKNISEEEFEKIKLISNGSTLNNSNNLLTIDKTDITIYLLVTEKELLTKLIFNIFNDTLNEELNELSMDTNNHTIELFKDPYFLTLLRICISKPDYLNKVANFITNGNISYKINTINREDFNYHAELEKFKTMLLNINIHDDELELMSILQHFDGNINLSLRYIISNKNI